MRIDESFVVECCQSLVRINSVNPTLVPGAPGEGEVAEWTAQALQELGLEVERFEPAPGRVSVLGRLPGTGGGRSLMLNAHIDTVGVDSMEDPFAGRVEDGRVYGRGAYDMKGSLAACLGAVRALRDAGVSLRGDVMVAAVADEEYGSLGTADLLTRVRPDCAIVTEPTGLDLCLAHKGYVWIEVVTEGRAAHGSRFREGIDANLRMGRVLGRLERLERELRQRTPHALVGPPSLHAALLAGGTGLSTYAARSRLQIERRTVPGETVEGVLAEVEGLLEELREEDSGFQAHASAFFAREPFEVPTAAPLVEMVSSAAAEVTGARPRVYGDTPWMDAALCAAAGVETVVFGPDGAGAHSAVEWVDVKSMVQCADVLARAAVACCG